MGTGVNARGAGILFFSGLAALAHQMLWTRRLVDLLGASSETFSAVVGAFFLGLSLGSAWAALYPAGPGQGWRRVVVMEVLVAMASLVPLLGVEWLAAAGVGGLGGWKWAITFGLIGPASMAMGVVFPAVSEACVGVGTGGGDLKARRRWLYACNTVGGMAGVALVFFVGLPWLGLRGTGLGACALNLGVAWCASRRQSAVIFSPKEARSGTRGDTRGDSPRDSLGAFPSLPGSIAGWRLGVLAFGSGFAVIGSEVVLQLQFAQVAINLHFSSATVLVLVLCGLAIAASLSRLGLGSRGALVWAGMVCLLEPWIFASMQPGLAVLPYELPPLAYFARLAILGTATVVVLMVAVGMAFPWILGEARGAKGVAAILALNGLGGWMGAEVLPGRVLPSLGLWCSMNVIAMVYGVFAWVAGSSAVGRWGSWRAYGLGAGLIAASVAALPRASTLPQVGRSPGETHVRVAVGREGVVATVNSGTNDWRMLMNNTYTLGGSKAWTHQERQALLPLLIQGRPKRVALLGFATGSTAAGASMAPGVEAIDAFELSPLVARMAAEYFRSWNRNVTADPRLRLDVEDARIGVSRVKEGTYDVVVGDLFLPWRTGEGRMYSKEHFRAVRRALAADGLFCQWLPLFQLTRTQFDGIVRTFSREFPSGFLVRGDFYADLPIVGLVGTRDGRGLGDWDWTRVGDACRALREAGGVTDPLVRHVEGIAMSVLGPIPDPGAGPINTLAGGWLEFEAGRNIVGLREPWHIGVPWAEYAREVHRSAVALFPDPLRSSHDAGQFFLTLEIAAASGSRVLDNLRRQIPERLPESMRVDRGATWEPWPSRVPVTESIRR